MSKERVVLQIPSSAKYISLARLAIAGLAVGQNLDMDQIEDLKILITETCNLSFRLGKKDTISIKIEPEDEKIQFSVSGISESDLKEAEEFALSFMIIESLSDGLEYRDDSIFVSKELGK